ncbi:ankyrin repeat domain-containing protein [Herminiimonas sp. KBW02]|uniref:ankyrin repeat domain-containing protein n=1 Tax=Herminiimonas sp. KBW02 TaxID=2153363 RepID=UPI001F159299|nr:ankyrin repeat domain-containing protein [Herminiimonas sp. KBW02]
MQAAECLPMRRLTLAVLLSAAALSVCPPLARAGAYEDYFRAVSLDDAQTVTALLKRGFDPNTIEGARGDSGLILAMREGSMKVFPVLLNARGIDLEQQARNGDTALMIAAFKANMPAVQALLAKGAAVNKSGWTALHYAAACGDSEIVRVLVKQGAELDARSPNNTTPMMMAARGGFIYSVKVLSDAGADASIKNDVGMSAIDFARENGSTDIVDGLTYRLKKAGKL